MQKNLRYLRDTIDLKFVINRGVDAKNPLRKLTGYSDADYAGVVSDRHSTGGYTYHLDETLILSASKANDSSPVDSGS
jgi:hypothetical protein